jgi:hypothetical protein
MQRHQTWGVPYADFRQVLSAMLGVIITGLGDVVDRRTPSFLVRVRHTDGSLDGNGMGRGRKQEYWLQQL